MNAYFGGKNCCYSKCHTVLLVDHSALPIGENRALDFVYYKPDAPYWLIFYRKKLLEGVGREVSYSTRQNNSVEYLLYTVH